MICYLNSNLLSLKTEKNISFVDLEFNHSINLTCLFRKIWMELTLWKEIKVKNYYFFFLIFISTLLYIGKWLTIAYKKKLNDLHDLQTSHGVF